MERGNSKHGQREDDALKSEMRGMLQGNRPSRVEEWRQAEPPADDDPDPVRTYTQRCTDVLEMYVRRYPELWLWMHRRWRIPTSAADVTPTQEDVL